jgi:hypothetical protein
MAGGLSMSVAAKRWYHKAKALLSELFGITSFCLTRLLSTGKS